MGSSQKVTVLQVGGEGGGLTLVGMQTERGWEYLLERADQTLTFIGEGEEINGIVGTCGTWRGALKRLDSYPWHMLFPLHVHPDFSARIWRAAKRRLACEPSSHALRRLERWREVCNQRGGLAKNQLDGLHG